MDTAMNKVSISLMNRKPRWPWSDTIPVHRSADMGTNIAPSPTTVSPMNARGECEPEAERRRFVAPPELTKPSRNDTSVSPMTAGSTLDDGARVAALMEGDGGKHTPPPLWVRAR